MTDLLHTPIHALLNEGDLDASAVSTQFDDERNLFVMVATGGFADQMQQMTGAFLHQIKTQQAVEQSTAPTMSPDEIKAAFKAKIDQVETQMACPECAATFHAKTWMRANPKAKGMLNLFTALTDLFALPSMTPLLGQLLPQIGAAVMRENEDVGNRLMDALQEVIGVMSD
jgi:hypothetical protein